MTNNVYRSWLTDRGIESPGAQPFELLGSFLDQGSQVLILADSSDPAASQIPAAVRKLSEALSSSELQVSWLLIKSGASYPDLKVLKAMLPSLTKFIVLTSGNLDSMANGFTTELKTIAGRAIDVFQGPSIDLMNHNPELKRRFWNDVRSWLSC